MEDYRVACPDVVEITVAGHSQISGEYQVGPEGRIQLAAMNNPRIEGQTMASLADRVAEELDLPVEGITCRVKEHRSRVVFAHGLIEGGDRMVPYRGAENVVDFLRRCGGLSRGAEVRDIAVVRGNVARGAKPEVLAVDLDAILLHGDARTNVALQPFDEVYVGETPRAKVGKALPHWMRPAYRGFCGTVPWLCPYDWRQQIRDPEP